MKNVKFKGPPGCGKTFLARAVAGEINASFIHLALKTNGKPQEDLQLDLVAKYTEHFSGADLEYLVKDAINFAIEQSFETGEIQPLTNEHLLKAMEKRQPTTLEWFATAKSYALFSDMNQEYKDVLDYIYKNNLK